MTESEVGERTGRTGPGNRTLVGRTVPVEPFVFALAVVARLAPSLLGAGLLGNYSYDPGVYFAAADALVHGRLPYRDFVFLHPPAIMLALAPFGWLARTTGDHAAFVAATVWFIVLGGVNAVLVVRIGKRMGLGTRAAALGGAWYALWLGSIGAEYEIRLETLGNLFVLCGLLAYFASRGARSPLPPLVCGLALGAATMVKIWWVVPLLVVLAWQLWAGPRRDVALAAGGAAVAMTVIGGPFLLLAPRQMFRMIVIEQLGRNANTGSPLSRMSDLTGVRRVSPQLGAAPTAAIVAVLVAIFLLVLALAWRTAAARLLVMLVLAQLLVLFAAPSWFAFYADFVAAPASLCVAAAVSSAPVAATTARFGWAERLRPVAWIPVGLVAAATAFAVLAVPDHSVAPYPGARLTRAVAASRCVMSDSPMALIQLNALSRGLAAKCPNWVDVSGRTYGVDAPPRRLGRMSRAENPRWQRDLLGYLESGDAVVLLRPGSTGISRRTMAIVRHYGVLARAGHAVVYRSRRQS